MFPYPLFGYENTYQNINVYSDRPISAALPSVLSIAEDRLRKSPLDDPALRHRVFICNDDWRFVLFANLDRNVGGLNHTWLNQNIFLRRANIEHNRLIGPRKRGSRERTSLTTSRTRLLTRWRSRTWAGTRTSGSRVEKRGLRRLRGQGRRLQFPRATGRIPARRDPNGSARFGLVPAIATAVNYLIDIKGVSPLAMLAQPFDQIALERELRAMKRPASYACSAPEGGGAFN